MANQRLGREMQDDVGPRDLQALCELVAIANVADAGLHIRADIRVVEQARMRGRRQRIASDARTEGLQEQRKPAALEARVPREENAFARPESRSHGHVFQGASPDFQSASSRFFSRNVSIGCQKELCLKARSWPSFASVWSGSFSQEVASSLM